MTKKVQLIAEENYNNCALNCTVLNRFILII